MKHEECWAKTTPSGRPGLSVEQHGRTAGTVARLMAAQCPPWLAERVGVQFGIALAALHDIGKVSPGFLCKCPAWSKEHGLAAVPLSGFESDHAKVSQRALMELLGRDDLRFWAAIVGAHHGRLKGERLQALADGGQTWAAERRRLVEALLAEFGPLPGRAPGHDSGALWFNAGLIAVADWLASDERHFPPSMALDATEIRARAERQLGQIGFGPRVVVSGKCFTDLFSFTPNALQTVLAEAVRKPGVYVVEATMGCGKTEAALMAAYNLLASGQATGVYFALPTQVTSNRIHQRVAEFVGRLAPGTDTRLIHGGSWLLDSAEQAVGGEQHGSPDDREGRRDGRDWFASSRRALLVPYGVGTVDQALLGVVAAKHFFVRQFALAGKVVILDEVHSYDLYTGTLLDRLVKRLRELGATVIVLSATLTAARRHDLLGCGAPASDACSAYPLVSASLGTGDDELQTLQLPVTPDPPKTVQVRFKPPTDLAEACLERAARGQCVLWIRNTVNDAQGTYRQLCAANRVGGPEIALMHARFPQYRREEIESDWLDRLGKDHARRPTGGCVLVSTQVAEQSVDIDADLLITDLAPTDMLLQRLGRLWRHPRLRPAGCAAPEVWVTQPQLNIGALRSASAREFKAAFGKSAKVYAPYVLLRTFALWRDLAELGLPGDIRPLLEATYAEPSASEPAAWGELRKELEGQREKLRFAATAGTNPWQLALDDEEGVQTRWNACPTAAVLLVREVVSWDTKRGAILELLNGDRCEMRVGQFVFEAAKAIHRNLVKVPRWCVGTHLARTPRWMDEYVRGGLVVCALAEERLMQVPGGDDTGLTYRTDLGVMLASRPVAPVRTFRDEEEDDDESYD